jgi:hypothetical protein
MCDVPARPARRKRPPQAFSKCPISVQRKLSVSMSWSYVCGGCVPPRTSGGVELTIRARSSVEGLTDSSDSEGSTADTADTAADPGLLVGFPPPGPPPAPKRDRETDAS